MKDFASAEAYFAQHLASNDNKIRNRAVKKLRAWLTMRSSGGADFTEEDMLKIWKGLFYCMWMCDKPINQENLADNISEMVHCFAKPKFCMRFIDTFFQSMAKEWHGIDRYRIEKFMLLVRRFIYQCFCVLSKNLWKPQLVTKLLKVLRKKVINPLRDETPQGLKMHVVDIYLDELAKAGGCELKPKKLNKLLKPYIIFLTVCEDSSQLNAVVKEVFHPLIWQAFHQEDDDDEDADSDETVTFQVKFNKVADLLLKYASSEDRKLSTKNQKIVYKLVAQLRSAARGEFPFRNVDSEDDNEDHKLNKKDINRAARELVEDELKISNERRERLKEIREKRKRKKQQGNQNEDDSDSDLNTSDLQLQAITQNFKESEPPRKRKRKNKPMKGKGSKQMKGKGKKSMKGKGNKPMKGKGSKVHKTNSISKSSKMPRRKKFQKR